MKRWKTWELVVLLMWFLLFGMGVIFAYWVVTA